MTRPSWQDYGTYDESEHARLWDGVVGAWCPSLGPTGSRLHDHSRANNWGTLTSMTLATCWTSDAGQYAIQFDGTDDVITAAVPPVAGLTNCTQLMWFRRTVVSARSSLFGVGVPASTGNRFVLQPWSDTNIYVSVDTAFASFVSEDLLWHHLVAVFTGGGATNDTRLAVYFDGVRQTLSFSGTIPATIGSPTGVRFGQTYNAAEPYGSGLISEAAIYNRALTQNEIRDLYLLGRGGMYQRRRRSRRRAIEQAAGFRAYWVRQKNQIIGGGV